MCSTYWDETGRHEDVYNAVLPTVRKGLSEEHIFTSGRSTMVNPPPDGVRPSPGNADRGPHTTPDGGSDQTTFLAALGKRVRFLRLQAEQTQDDLARAAGMSRSFISLIEHGSHGVDIVRLLRLATALQTSLLELIDVTDARCSATLGLSGPASMPLEAARVQLR